MKKLIQGEIILSVGKRKTAGWEIPSGAGASLVRGKNPVRSLPAA